MEKTIFISHSSKDHPFAEKLVNLLEQNEMFCWIAPRDIPYGEQWAGEITEAIQKARVMIFIFSDNSNQSEQVVREIQLALQYGLTVITLRISDQPYNRALEYYLSTLHWAQIEDEEEDGTLHAFVGQIKRYLCGEPIDPQPGSRLRLPESSSVNLDKELEATFQRIFGKADEKKEKEEISPMRRRLLDRIGERFVENATDPSMDPDEPSDNSPACTEAGSSFTLSENDGKHWCLS